MIKNKKAGERILSIYLFIIYIVVAIGIVSGVLLVYGSKLDIREIEAEVLNDKVIDCLTEQGNLEQEVFEQDFDLLSFCGFDFKDNSGKYQGEEQYGVSIELFDFDSLIELKEKIVFGREDFLEFCGLEGKKIPKCSEKKIYVLNIEVVHGDYAAPFFADPDDISLSGVQTGEGIEEGLIENRVLLKVISAVGKIKENV